MVRARTLLKPRWYRRGDGAFYPQSNTLPTACESWALGPCAYSVEPHCMDFSLVRVELVQWKMRGRAGSNSKPWLWYQIEGPPPLANPTIKHRWYRRARGPFILSPTYIYVWNVLLCLKCIYIYVWNMWLQLWTVVDTQYLKRLSLELLMILKYLW
jgi:hypothetical protein